MNTDTPRTDAIVYSLKLINGHIFDEEALQLAGVARQLERELVGANTALRLMTEAQAKAERELNEANMKIVKKDEVLIAQNRAALAIACNDKAAIELCKISDKLYNEALSTTPSTALQPIVEALKASEDYMNCQPMSAQKDRYLPIVKHALTLLGVKEGEK